MSREDEKERQKNLFVTAEQVFLDWFWNWKKQFFRVETFLARKLDGSRNFFIAWRFLASSRMTRKLKNESDGKSCGGTFTDTDSVSNTDAN